MGEGSPAAGEARLHLEVGSQGDAVGFEDTIVTLEFHDRGKATELILIHEKLATVEEREKHEHGWKGCLDQLARYISKRSAA